MNFVSYAQNFEDVLLWRALHDVLEGRYIDIGAHHPVVDSVSLAFYNAGWRGLHVEPIPFHAALLRDARPEEAVVQAAVTDEPGPILFYELSGLSSGCKEIADHHARSGHIAHQMFVPTVRLEQLLRKIDAEIHWLKIDVEGMEAEVLRSWGNCDIRPWVLVIEATLPNTQERTQHLWIDEILKRGYSQVFFDGLSCYFLHEAHQELRDRFAVPANIFDNFQITADHFSARQFRADQESSEHRLGETECRLSELTEKLNAAEEDLQREQGKTIELKGQADAARDEEYRALERLAVFEKAYVDTQEKVTSMQAALADARVDSARLEEQYAKLQQQLEKAEEAGCAAATRLRELQERIILLNGLVQAAVTVPASPWQRLGEALGFSRNAPQLQALAAWQADMMAGNQPGCSAHQIPIEGAETDMHPPALMRSRNPYLRADSLDELLSWHDVDFVRCAYVTMLGRQPDPRGEIYYTARIRRGHSKLEILRQLRLSAEGRQHDPGIAGLDRALKRAHWARNAIWGPVYRLVSGTHDDDNRSARQHRALLNEIEILRAEQARLRTIEVLISKVDQNVSLMALRFGGIQLPQSASLSTVPIPHLDRSLVDPIEMSGVRNGREIIERLSTAVNASREIALLARP
jgi:FkbM family methyltransferase